MRLELGFPGVPENTRDTEAMILVPLVTVRARIRVVVLTC